MNKRTRALAFLMGLAALLLIAALLKKAPEQREAPPAAVSPIPARKYSAPPPVGPACPKCGSTRRASILDQGIMKQQSAPPGLGPHPTPVEGLSYKCLNCGETIEVYPSHWHGTAMKTPCPLCQRKK